MNNQISSLGHSKIRAGAVIFGLLFLLTIQNHTLGFYNPETVKSSYLSDSKGFSSDFSALQAESLLRGHIDVLPTPVELLLLSDPYDPEQNKLLRESGYHDLSYFKGKIYSPQGFGAPLLIDLPTRLLGLGYASPPLKSLLLIASGTFFLFLICEELLSRIRKIPLTKLQNTVLLSIILFSNPATWLLVPGRSYQVPIAAAYFAINAGAYLTWKGIELCRVLLISCGSIFIGLAFMARPNIASLVLSVVVILGFCSFKLYSKVIFLRHIFFMSLCVGTIITLWGLLNNARFGSYTQTGHAYQLAGFNMRNYDIGSSRFITENLNAYFLTPLQFHREFPFFSLTASNADDSLNLQQREDLTGLFFAYPLLCMAPVFALFLFRSKKQYLSLVALLFTSSTVSLILLSAIFKDSTMRYIPDFSTGLVLVTAISVPLYLDFSRSGKMSSFFYRFSCIAFISVLVIEFNLLLSQCSRC